MTTAINAPNIGIQTGHAAGRVNASSIPINTGEKSPISIPFFSISREATSNITKLITLNATITIALAPKIYAAQISAGTSAIIMSTVIMRVVSSWRR